MSDGNSLLLSMPRHVWRATASPLILRLRLWFKLPVRISVPDRTFGALLLRTAPPLASGPSPSRLRTSDAINDETGMTRCLAMKSMHFIDRCFPVAAASRRLLAVIDPIHDIAVTSSIGLKMTALTSTLMLFCTG